MSSESPVQRSRSSGSVAGHSMFSHFLNLFSSLLSRRAVFWDILLIVLPPKCITLQSEAFPKHRRKNSINSRVVDPVTRLCLWTGSSWPGGSVPHRILNITTSNIRYWFNLLLFPQCQHIKRLVQDLYLWIWFIHLLHFRMWVWIFENLNIKIFFNF